jgi:hypothetical protein
MKRFRVVEIWTEFSKIRFGDRMNGKRELKRIVIHRHCLRRAPRRRKNEAEGRPARPSPASVGVAGWRRLGRGAWNPPVYSRVRLAVVLVVLGLVLDWRYADGAFPLEPASRLESRPPSSPVGSP